MSQNIPFWLGLRSVNTGVPNGLLMLRNSLNDFVLEHQSGCCATKSGYAGDIAAIEICLIDWRPTQVQELFTLVPHIFGTTSHFLSVQPLQLLPSTNISRHMSLTWPFSLRHQHTCWPVDATELFHRFCYWTPIHLLCHWAWLLWGYWCYRNLIDWLIDWLKLSWNFYLATYFFCKDCSLAGTLYRGHWLQSRLCNGESRCCISRVSNLIVVPQVHSQWTACYVM